MIQINIKHTDILSQFIQFSKQMLLFIAVEDNIQKQLFADVLQNRCSWKYRNIHRKTPVLEQLYEKEFPAQVFPFEYCQIFKNSWWWL